jgi:hypothetical protein
MEDSIYLNEEYQMLFCRFCKSAIRPGASIELHFRQVHQLKGKVLKDIKDFCGVMELVTRNPLHYWPVWTISEALGGKRKQPRSIAVFGLMQTLSKA